MSAARSLGTPHGTYETTWPICSVIGVPSLSWQNIPFNPSIASIEWSIEVVFWYKIGSNVENDNGENVYFIENTH